MGRVGLSSVEKSTAGALMVLSALGTAFTVLKLRIRWTAIGISCVRFLYLVFFVYLCIWCTLRAVFYIWRIWPYPDQLSIRGILHTKQASKAWMTALLCIGDAAHFAVVLVTFPLVYELFWIAKHAMDRGIARERARIRLYSWIIHAILLLFMAVQTGLAIAFKGYTMYTYCCLLSVYVVQALSLLYTVWLLVALKTGGRAQAPVDGEVVRSPIYERLKRMLIVNAFFHFQFEVSIVINLALSGHHTALTEYTGVSLLLFSSTGLALSVITTCSQSCVMSMCKCCLHEDQFPARRSAARLINERPPLQNPVFVVTDIESSSELWAIDGGRTMQLATEIHDDILRARLLKYRGYEITTCGDSFQLAFHTIREAVEYCLDVQLELLVANWPKQLHNLVPATRKKRFGTRLIFSGLRVRMGIHDACESDGDLVCEPHTITGKMTYTGASHVIAAEIGDIGSGGQILTTQRVADWLLLHEDLIAIRFAVEHVKKFKISHVNTHLELFQVYPLLLKARLRHFHPPRLHQGASFTMAARASVTGEAIAGLLKWRLENGLARTVSGRAEDADVEQGRSLGGQMSPKDEYAREPCQRLWTERWNMELDRSSRQSRRRVSPRVASALFVVDAASLHNRSRHVSHTATLSSSMFAQASRCGFTITYYHQSNAAAAALGNCHMFWAATAGALMSFSAIRTAFTVLKLRIRWSAIDISCVRFLYLTFFVSVEYSWMSGVQMSLELENGCEPYFLLDAPQQLTLLAFLPVVVRGMAEAEEKRVDVGDWSALRQNRRATLASPYREKLTSQRVLFAEPTAGALMALSAIYTAMTVLKLRIRWTAIDISCARFLYLVFFVYACLWCTSRTIYYVWRIWTFPDDLTGDNARDPFTYSELDRLGIHALLHTKQASKAWITALICFGDAAHFAFALVTFPLVYELFWIASNAMDRGKAKERVRIRWYSWVIHAMLLVFIIVETVFAISFDGYTKYTHCCLLFVYVVQALSLLYMVWLLVVLKIRGRSQAPIDGEFVRSPVYERLKRMLIVYAIFHFQFEVSLVVVFATRGRRTALVEYTGVSLLLFNSTGLALSIITTCSQSCVMSMCKCCIPDTREDQFPTRNTHIGQINQRAPMQNPVFVVTDIESSSELWAIDGGRTMQLATEIHDDILRARLLKYRGYEITTCGDSFQLAFHTIREAVEYCLDVQLELLVANWPKQLHNLVPATRKKRFGTRLIFSGLRVRMGIHDACESDGDLVCEPHTITGKMTYTGASHVIAAEIGDIGSGGQILTTQRVADWLLLHEDLIAIRFAVEHVKKFKISHVNTHLELFQVYPLLLKARLRHFHPPRLHQGASFTMVAGRASTTGEAVAGLLQWGMESGTVGADSDSIEDADNEQIRMPRSQMLTEVESGSTAGVLTALSAIATAFTVLKLRIRWTTIDISCARFLHLVFFVYVCLWCTSRAIIYIWMCTLPRDKFVDDDTRDPFTYSELDRLGIHAILHIKEASKGWVAALICFGDVALFAFALVMFPLVYELFRIATHTMDRGIAKERARIRLYCLVIHAMLLVFTIVEIVFAVVFKGYTKYTHDCLLFAYVVQAISLLYMVWLLVVLKVRGRAQEPIDGEFVRSPVYDRLKRMMIVYAIFQFQFEVSSVVFFATSRRHTTLIGYMGVSLLLINSTGLALSIITTCSQSCVLSMCKCCLPDDLEAQLPAHITDADLINERAPMQNPVFVVTDIESSSELWAIDGGRTMQLATEIHDDILRARLLKYRGYEITTCGDSFQLAFHTIREAVEYCLDVQLELLVANWPKQLHNLVPATRKKRFGTRLIFSGLRVRMGIHDACESDGDLVCEPHTITGKMTYTGASHVIAAEVGDIGSGGQILTTQRVADWLLLHEDLIAIRFAVEHVKKFKISHVNTHLELFQVYPLLLKARLRHFHPLRLHQGGTMSSSSTFVTGRPSIAGEASASMACLLQWRLDSGSVRRESGRVEDADDEQERLPGGQMSPEDENVCELHLGAEIDYGLYLSAETPREQACI
ncbi:Cullin-associated nedd8-dissociated protein 1, partial [Globisporangium splendens]